MNPQFETLSKAYAKANQELRQKILLGAEKHVEAQVDLLKSADARATGLLAVCAALAAAGIAFAADNIKDKDPVFWAAVAFIFASLMATLAAVWAVWPCKIRLPGWEPKTFLFDIESDRSENNIEAEMIALLQIRIDTNDRILLQLGWRARLSYVLVGYTPVLSLIGWILSQPPHGIGVLLAIFPLVSIAYMFAEHGRAVGAHRKKFG